MLGSPGPGQITRQKGGPPWLVPQEHESERGKSHIHPRPRRKRTVDFRRHFRKRSSHPRLRRLPPLGNGNDLGEQGRISRLRGLLVHSCVPRPWKSPLRELPQQSWPFGYIPLHGLPRLGHARLSARRPRDVLALEGPLIGLRKVPAPRSRIGSRPPCHVKNAEIDRREVPPRPRRGAGGSVDKRSRVNLLARRAYS